MIGILRVVVVITAGVLSAAAAAPDRDRPLPDFTGFGLGDFTGAGSIAAALRRAGVERPADEPEPLPGVAFRGVAVQGPSGRDMLSPIAAEVRSRIEQFDVAAGVGARHDRLADGPTQWTGRIGVGHERPEGSARLDLRTTLGSPEAGGVLGLEIGPRLERRLPRGVTLFIDGRAEARAARGRDGSLWPLPGPDRDGTFGVNARAGIVR